VRIKHRLNDNSVKLYDKSFTELVCLMRAEGTFNSVKDFRVYRLKEGDPEGELACRPGRKSRARLDVVLGGNRGRRRLCLRPCASLAPLRHLLASCNFERRREDDAGGSLHSARFQDLLDE
jgi:hypothetical protein